MDRDDHALRDAIAERLKLLGLRPVELARKLGIRQQTVSKWLSGENTPPPARWRELEEVLGFEHGHFAKLTGLVEGDDASRDQAALRLILERIEIMQTELRGFHEMVTALLAASRGSLEDPREGPPGRSRSVRPRGPKR